MEYRRVDEAPPLGEPPFQEPASGRSQRRPATIVRVSCATMTNRVAWRVYSRPGCCLCEQLIEELAALLGPAAAHAEVVDISDDAALERKYGARIPVLLADGEFVCAYRLDHARVQQLMGAGTAGTS